MPSTHDVALAREGIIQFTARAAFHDSRAQYFADVGEPKRADDHAFLAGQARGDIDRLEQRLHELGA